jgi:serine/threonine protein kinase
MPLSSGSRLGPYEIVSLIGEGGMGEVYKASDTRLNRTVAIKVLPPQWAADTEMRQRFDREARTVASLSHPHICTLHDIGREHIQPTRVPGSADAEAAAPETVDFLVMEYLEGQTLAKRLERGALPLDEALKVATAIAEALDRAHRDGVIHRDLKPANVMLTPQGAKLLDFGLAKLEPGRPLSSPSGGGPASAPKGPVSKRATAPGMIIGTVQYMAPEQIEGAAADARTDIFAFGAILYEMVTGTKAFEGKNRAMLIAAIATLELDPLSKIQPGSPPALDHVARRCLAKDPEDRWQTAHDLALKLRWIAEGGLATSPPTIARRPDTRAALLLGVSLLVLAATALPAFLYLRRPDTAEAFQFRVPVAGLNDADIALSPDGQMIALVARPNTQEASSLFVRAVNSTTFRRLGGTNDSSQPFWSPDSRTIGFVAAGRLKRVDAAGGAPKDIAEVSGFAGGAWNATGTILFGSPTGIYRVSAEGGRPEPITTVEKAESGHFWPTFLPDGRRFLYLAWSTEAADRAVFTGQLGTGERARLVSAESNAVYAPSGGSPAPGYLIFHRQATLFAQPFDAANLASAGDPIHLADQVAFNPSNGRGNFDVSQNGVLLYYQSGGGALGGPSGRGQTIANAVIGWSDSTGRRLGLAGEQGTYGDMDLSPDGKFVAITRQESGPGADIWVIDWERAGVPLRLTLDPADDINPVWAPSGDRVAFTTYRKGNADIYVKNANGVGNETPLVESPANELVEDWSKDGRYLAYKVERDAVEDIYVLPLSGSDSTPIPVVTGPYRKDEPQFSYDGKWLAYTSNESGGTFEVYVVSFPALDQKLRISAIGGGGQPRWRRDGKELYYRGPDGAAMAVDIKVGPRLEAGIPRRLFNSHTTAPSSRDPVRHQWSVTPDGQRFLLRYPNNSAASFSGSQGGAAILNFTSAAQGPATTIQSVQGTISTGLTVIRHWPAAAGKSAK